jgi:hypothetical protein
MEEGFYIPAHALWVEANKTTTDAARSSAFKIPLPNALLRVTLGAAGTGETVQCF